MTTLLITEIFPPKIGGSGRRFWEIYRRLPRQEYVIAAGEDPFQQEFDRTHNLRVVRVPLTLSDLGMCSPRGVMGYWRAVRALRPSVRRERIRLVHAGRCVPEGWIAYLMKAMYGLPYACHVHGEDVNVVSDGPTSGVMSSRQLRWMTRATLRGSEFLVANSLNTAQILQREWRMPSRRIRLLVGGVDTHRFVPAPREAAIRAKLGWGDRRVVLTVGRLQMRKGHDRMIVALRQIRDSIPDVLYAIVGSGEELAVLQKLVAQHDLGQHVQFLGSVDDDTLVRSYQQCDLFVLPNRQIGTDIEGFGLVLLEAQACGKPVIAGASGGTSETMQIPTTGRIVSCDDPRELAAEVVDLLLDGDRLQRMGEAARLRTVEHFDWTTLSRQAQQLLRP